MSFQVPGPHASAVQAGKIGLHTRVCVVLGHTSVYVDHADKAFYGPVLDACSIIVIDALTTPFFSRLSTTVSP